MFAKLFCFVFLLTCIASWLPKTEGNMFGSTYGGWSNEPSFAPGLRKVIDFWKGNFIDTIKIS